MNRCGTSCLPRSDQLFEQLTKAGRYTQNPRPGILSVIFHQLTTTRSGIEFQRSDNAGHVCDLSDELLLALLAAVIVALLGPTVVMISRRGVS